MQVLLPLYFANGYKEMCTNDLLVRYHGETDSSFISNVFIQAPLTSAI